MYLPCVLYQIRYLRNHSMLVLCCTKNVCNTYKKRKHNYVLTRYNFLSYKFLTLTFDSSCFHSPQTQTETRTWSSIKKKKRNIGVLFLYTI